MHMRKKAVLVFLTKMVIMSSHSMHFYYGEISSYGTPFKLSPNMQLIILVLLTLFLFADQDCVLEITAI